MEPIAFAVDKFNAFRQWSHEFFDAHLHRRRESSSRSRNPIEILKRLQREAFSDLMKLRDRQDKVERILSLYKTANGSPFQEAGTVLRGEIDYFGALLLKHNVEDDDIGDAFQRTGIRTGLQSRFCFETAIRENDALIVEFVSSQKPGNDLYDGIGSPLSLAKVFYTANAGDWLSAFAIPMGGKCSDVAIVTNPLHQGKGLTGFSSSGPPLLSQQNGSAIGLMVKKSNIVASLAQFVSGPVTPQDSDGTIGHCLGTFGQVAYQLPRGTKLSILGLLQLPKLAQQPVNRGPFTLPFGGRKRQEIPEQTMVEFASPMRTDSHRNVSTGSIVLMAETEVDEFLKIGGWIEMNKSDPKHFKLALSLSDDSEDSFGWGMRYSGTTEDHMKLDQFKLEAYLKFNFGKRFSVKTGGAYIKEGNTQMTALMLRSNWSI